MKFFGSISFVFLLLLIDCWTAGEYSLTMNRTKFHVEGYRIIWRHTKIVWWIISNHSCVFSAKKSKCEKEREQAVRKLTLKDILLMIKQYVSLLEQYYLTKVTNYIPLCYNGTYSPWQVTTNTGETWCVTAAGEKIPGR